MRKYLTILLVLSCLLAWVHKSVAEEVIDYKKLLATTPWKRDIQHENQWTAYVGNGDSRALIRAIIAQSSQVTFIMKRPCVHTKNTERLTWVTGDRTGTWFACDGKHSYSTMPPILEGVLGLPPGVGEYLGR